MLRIYFQPSGDANIITSGEIILINEDDEIVSFIPSSWEEYNEYTTEIYIKAKFGAIELDEAMIEDLSCNEIQLFNDLSKEVL